MVQPPSIRFVAIACRTCVEMAHATITTTTYTDRFLSTFARSSRPSVDVKSPMICTICS
jgi:hypothetical protein